MAKIISSDIKGIRYREHDTRKHGKQKDEYYFIRYTHNQKTKEEGVGWASEGWTLQKVAKELFEIKENIRKGEGHKSLAEKREMAEKAKKEQEQQIIETESERITLREVFERYSPVHKVETVEKTWKNTVAYYNNWIDKKLGSKKLVEITVDDIQEIINKALSERTPRTAEFIKAVFRQIFNFAINRDLYFKNNPAMKISIPSFDNKRTFFFSNEQAEELIRRLYIRREIVGDIVNLAFHTGCRAAEIFNLDWKSVDLKNRFLMLLNTKHGKSTRYIPMDETAFEILSRRAKIDKEGIVFKNNKGETFKEMPDCYNEVLQEMGLRKKGMTTKELPVFYSVRHTFASNLVINNVNLREVQTLMGHSTSQMTERYSHLAPDHLKKAISKLNYKS